MQDVGGGSYLVLCVQFRLLRGEQLFVILSVTNQVFIRIRHHWLGLNLPKLIYTPHDQVLWLMSM